MSVRSEEDTGVLGTGVPDDCEASCQCLELNLGLLQEQQVLLLLSPFSSFDFLLFTQSGTLANGMVLPTFGVAFPSLAKPFWKHCQRRTMVILNPVKLTMEISHQGAHGGQDLASPSRGPRSSQLCTRQRFVACVEKAHSE